MCPSPVDWYQSQRPETQPRNLPFLHPDPVIPQVPCIPAPATYSSLPLLYPTTTRPQRLCELPPLALCSLLQSCPYPPPTLSTGTSRQSHLSKTQILPCFGIAFPWDWNENWPFPVLWPLLSFSNLLAYRVKHFKRIIFWI